MLLGSSAIVGNLFRPTHVVRGELKLPPKQSFSVERHMNESSTTAKSARLNGNSNTAKAKPASQLTNTPRVTVATPTNMRQRKRRPVGLAFECSTHSSSPQRVMLQRQRPHPLPRRRKHRIHQRRRQWRHPRFAHRAPWLTGVGAARHDVGFNARRLVHPQQRVVVKIPLLCPPGLECDFA